MGQTISTKKQKDAKRFDRILAKSKDLIEARKKSELSDGEKAVAYFLRKSLLEFRREWYWPGLINPKTQQPLFFDFYLPALRMVIEYDGPHHFEPVYGLKALHEQQYRDKLKKQFCKKKKIKLLRIPYHTLNIGTAIQRFFDESFSA